jgi:dipeptidase E
MRLLLLSNSKNYGGEYLEHAKSPIKEFLGSRIRKTLFIPFAGVRISFDSYTTTVRSHFQEMGYELEPVHQSASPVDAVKQAEAIVVGGGNTFHLLLRMYETGLIEAIRERVKEGTPFIGWSAGSNVACPTIKTTNDMPIVEPPSFNALGLVPFQINPHYTDAQLAGHQGETRAERISEFVEVNPNIYVVGLREGSILRVEGNKIELLGEKGIKVFLKGKDPVEYSPKDSLQFLLNQHL